MKLLHAAASPFVRKVRVLIEEAGQTDKIELVDGFGSPVQPSTAAIAANPLGKIPSLILDDGMTLYDSRVITRYLDSHFSLGLYPAGDQAWKTLTLEAHADALLDAGILCVYEVRCRDESVRSEDWLEAQRGKVQRGLDALEQNWVGHLQGPLDIGHIGVGCVLDYLDFRREMGGFADWREGRPGLQNWANDFLQRASMQATSPD